MERNIWRDGIMGVVAGDALGCPVQFRSRKELALRPVDSMKGHGAYDMPPGTWTDDSSLTLALLDSIRETGRIDLPDIMSRFVLWLEEGAYTPFGEAFDIGGSTMESIARYMKNGDVTTCGGTSAEDRGNGALMRILPACLYEYERRKKGVPDALAADEIHQVSALTHNRMRSKIACGLYYYMVCAVLDEAGPLQKRLQKGIDEGFRFYERSEDSQGELACYNRLRDLKAFAALPEAEIQSFGYVKETLEASVWSLIQTDSFRDCLLRAVNLGEDTDTVAAIAGGLAGLYYGYDAIPGEWLAAIQRREWIEKMCLMDGKVGL